MTPEQKELFIKNSIKHFEADDILIRGTYDHFDDSFRGCSIGCHAFDLGLAPHVNADDIHHRVASIYGYPTWLAHLQDSIFEGLPVGEHKQWHVDFAKAMPIDADWQPILHKVHIAILCIASKTAGSSKDIVQRVIELYERVLTDDVIKDEEWSVAMTAEAAAEGVGLSETAQAAVWQEIRDAVLEILGSC